jgi:hypothetical protein
MELLERERYTKKDILELVTREELIKMGIRSPWESQGGRIYINSLKFFRGGIACRIWRHILRVRLENSQKVHSSHSTLISSSPSSKFSLMVIRSAGNIHGTVAKMPHPPIDPPTDEEKISINSLV